MMVKARSVSRVSPGAAGLALAGLLLLSNGIGGTEAAARFDRPGRNSKRGFVDLWPRQQSNTTTGGDGSRVTLSNGTTITYNNPFGGTWASEPGDFSARAQSWSPALDEDWDYNVYRMFGVNLGGWLVTEPFITPNLYIPYQNSTPQAVDEYTLSQALGDDLESYMTEHYETFINEQDFIQIAAAGMNWIRLPVPYWMMETVGSEPYLEGVAWNYMLQAFEWARKYGIRVELDLHTVPGSQNGLNHSGRQGTIGLLNGVMGIVNAQRTINYIRLLTETISLPEYQHVQMFNVVNEAYVTTIGAPVIRSFYLNAYDTIRNISGIGLNKGPIIALHDGFVGLNTWDGYLQGADRIALESHYYFAFSVDAYETDFSQMINRPCQWWAPGFNTSTNNFGLTLGGEWSLAPNDCGFWLNAVDEGSKYDGTNSDGTARTGNCTGYTDVADFSDTFKSQLQRFTLANMDTFQNFMFWTWKTQNDLDTGRPYNPLWCYSCGLEYGYVPTDPRLARGACNRNAADLGISGYGSTVPLTGTFQASQTGNAGTSSSILAAQRSSYGVFPPTSLTNIPSATRLPQYVATGAEPAYPTTLPATLSVVQTGTPSAAGWYTAIAGCSYLDAYSGVGASVPAARCTGNGSGGSTNISSGANSLANNLAA